MAREKYSNLRPGHEPGKFIGKDGYVRIKVGGHWLFEHIVNWEQKNGPIPEGYYLKFKDKNKSNTSPDNLILKQHSTIKEKETEKMQNDIVELNIRILELEKENDELKEKIKVLEANNGKN